MRNPTLAAAVVAVAAAAFSLPMPTPAHAQTSPPPPAAMPTNNAPPPQQRIVPQTSTTGPGKAAPNAANTGNVAPETTAALPPATMPMPGSRRVSRLIGAAVVNGQNQSIGKIDDIVIGANDQAVYAVISVGGFLGIGAKLVAVPYSELKVAADNKSMTLPGATKAHLEAMPEFKYQGA